MPLQSDGLVLAAKGVGEKDRLVTVLSREQGIVYAYANGAQKPGNRLQSATQPFCYGQYEFARRKDTYTLTEAQPRELFFGLAAEPARLALAAYLAQLAEAVCPRDEPAPEQLRLLLNTLHYLCTGRRAQGMLKAVAELRLITLAGLMPDLESYEPGQPALLDCAGGRLLPCPAGAAPPACRALPPAAAAALLHICTQPLERVFAFSIPEEPLQRLAEAAQEYVRRQWGGRLPVLQVFK
ncbi:MAG: DNA repair protein RecO [Oscillospiraceae bacterium]|jgi:DNA repair protein RecO (recombination protein O)|nr:DNA repair protein RecO [Oscillospiraceae bacterium]